MSRQRKTARSIYRDLTANQSNEQLLDSLVYWGNPFHYEMVGGEMKFDVIRDEILKRMASRDGASKMAYDLAKARRGYEVVKCGSRHGCLEGLSGDKYLVSVRNGVCTWCEDFTYAKHYSLETASKHIEALRKGEIA